MQNYLSLAGSNCEKYGRRDRQFRKGEEVKVKLYFITLKMFDQRAAWHGRTVSSFSRPVRLKIYTQGRKLESGCMHETGINKSCKHKESFFGKQVEFSAEQIHPSQNKYVGQPEITLVKRADLDYLAAKFSLQICDSFDEQVRSNVRAMALTFKRVKQGKQKQTSWFSNGAHLRAEPRRTVLFVGLLSSTEVAPAGRPRSAISLYRQKMSLLT
jgi:hypothetical protein